MPLEIDKRDARGRTALWWAARRGDEKAVRTLLKCGACPDICDEQGVSPLSCATFPKHTGCLQLLLEYNAKFSSSKIGYSPLHQAAVEQDDPYYLELLLPHVESVDPITCQGDTPLTTASQRGRYNMAVFLLDSGAKVNGADPNMYWTPLTSAIQGCKSDVVKLLLSRGADHRLLSPGKQNILHSAAMFADTQLLDTLSEFNLYGIERDLRDKFGMRPWDYLCRRSPDDDLVRSFDRLLRKVRDSFHRCANELAGKGGTGDADEIRGDDESYQELFIDALELQTV
jgi:ankyrin repeat protein